MEFDLNEEQRRLIVQFLANATYPISDEDEVLLWRFADALEHCGTVGTTLHVN